MGLPDLTPEEAVQEIKDAGYDGVEWRVTRVPDEVKGEEPSFWGNNLCTLAPTEEEARRARRISEEAGLEVPGLGTYVAVRRPGGRGRGDALRSDCWRAPGTGGSRGP